MIDDVSMYFATGSIQGVGVIRRKMTALVVVLIQTHLDPLTHGWKFSGLFLNSGF